MSGTVKVTKVAPAELYEELRRIRAFAELKLENLNCLGDLEVVEAEAGTEVLRELEKLREAQGDPRPAEQDWRSYWVLLEGRVRLFRHAAEREPQVVATFEAGDSFGEIPILTRRARRGESARAEARSRLVRFDEEAFWELMFSCPRVRSAVLGDMALRLEKLQADAVHREKLALLGTMSAGLMHELNNPGAAARRAAAQLRENLKRLQEISLRMARKPPTPEQMECMAGLQEQALLHPGRVAMSSLQQADAEEALASWLERSGVSDGWRLAPSLVSSGIDEKKLACVQGAFHAGGLPDVLHWLEALISSVQLVGTVEESIARIAELVKAVKQYSYEGKGVAQNIDLHASIQSTLVIMAHKIKAKGLNVRKEFAAEPLLVETRGQGLNQVWTNLLDNAIDASLEGGTIVIRTRLRNGRAVVSVCDNGAGIPEANQARIFEPFFTTKQEGQGTGLGLDIARRVVVEQMDGDIRFRSGPGETEFTVELPLLRPRSQESTEPAAGNPH